MNREDLIEALRSFEQKLVLEGVEHLYLFGSFARNQATAQSDIDLAFDIQPECELKFSLIDQSRIQRELTAAMNRKVDLVERAYLRPRIGASAARDTGCWALIGRACAIRRRDRKTASCGID